MANVIQHLLLIVLLQVVLVCISDALEDSKESKCYLSNCNKCHNIRTCAKCDDGYRRRYVRYGRRTICVSNCAPTHEDYMDSEGQLACRKRTDLEGCVTEWCLKCKDGFVRVSKGSTKTSCEKQCPPNFDPVYQDDLETEVCMQKPIVLNDYNNGDEEERDEN